MVKRWEAAEFNMVLDETGGEYVLYSDYLALQKALETALNGWEGWVDTGIPESLNEQDVIDQLRSQYLKGEGE